MDTCQGFRARCLLFSGATLSSSRIHAQDTGCPRPPPPLINQPSSPPSSLSSPLSSLSSFLIVRSLVLLVSREDYIEKVRGAAKKSRNPYLSIIWTEGGAQPALEEATGLTFGYPAVVAISVEKKARNKKNMRARFLPPAVHGAIQRPFDHTLCLSLLVFPFVSCVSCLSVAVVVCCLVL